MTYLSEEISTIICFKIFELIEGFFLAVLINANNVIMQSTKTP